jgi:hypothetical protein
VKFFQFAVKAGKFLCSEGISLAPSAAALMRAKGELRSAAAAYDVSARKTLFNLRGKSTCFSPVFSGGRWS